MSDHIEGSDFTTPFYLYLIAPDPKYRLTTRDKDESKNTSFRQMRTINTTPMLSLTHPLSLGLFALTVTLGVSTVTYAQQPNQPQPQTWPPRPTERCQVLKIDSVPATYSAFEVRITQWMATCVTSRSRDLHRELTLVRDNRSLRATWQALPKGKPARIIPNYTWGPFRVTSITFSSPNTREPAGHSTGRFPQPAGEQTGNGPSPDGDGNIAQSTLPTGRPASRPVIQPRPTGTPIHPFTPELPNEAEDFLFDARRLVRDMRQNGKTEAADQLDQHIVTAAKTLGSIALLAGGYYVGVKLRAGRILFAWGWNATGEHFARTTARLERLLPEAEKAIGEIITSAKPHLPPAGSGLDWPLLDQVVNGTVTAQIDGAACGPACLAIVLAERGIKLTQQELLRRARSTIPKEIKSKRVGIKSLLSVLQKIDPTGNWTGGPDIEDVLHGRNARQVMEHLGRNGSWIAQVGSHFVVIDEYRDGHLYVHDPWYEPARSRGLIGGSSYQVSIRTFLDYWYVAAIYRD